MFDILTPVQKIIISSTKTGDHIVGTLFNPVKPNGKAILFIHGWGSDESGYVSRAKVLAEIGYVCFTFSLPGHGDSVGDIRKLTRSDYICGVIDAYDFLAKQNGVGPEKIGVIGSSFGGYLAAILTKRRAVRWLVLRAPANYPDEGFDDIPLYEYIRNSEFAKEWRQNRFNFKDTEALRAVHEFPNNILIVESGNDTVVPQQCLQNYADAVKDKTKLTYIVLKDADHALTDAKQQREFIDLLSEWFRRRKQNIFERR